MHRAHDYRHLIKRWKQVAQAAKLSMRSFAIAAGYNIFCIKTRALKPSGGIYVSAGIHGDEAASTDGLIQWAEENVDRLPDLPMFMLPCLNPWGLVNNIRVNEMGLDLNRSFHRNDVPVMTAVKELIAPYQFLAAIMLHEDYDGQGLYLYEVERVRPYWGEALLAAAQAHLPLDPRMRIDGRLARAGVIRRRFDLRRFERLGYPEAIYLHQHH